jgi:hypothetical protein
MAKSDYQVHIRPSVCLSVCVAVNMEQLGSNGADFHEVRYLSVVSENCFLENSSLITI